MSNDESRRDSIKNVLLEHDRRRAIYETIEEQPGPTKHQLADELDTHPAIVDYHVQRLILYDLLVQVRNAEHDDVLFFHPEQVQPWADDEACTLLGRLPLQTVAAYVAEHPGTTAEQTAHALDRDPETVDTYLHTLQTKGLVQTTGDGPRPQYEPADTLEPWLAEFRKPNDLDDPGNLDEPEDPGDEEQTDGDEP